MAGDSRVPLTRKQTLVAALLLAMVVMWMTGAIPRWGQWYGPEPYYRAQVEAFLHGHLALSDQPEAVTHDLAWVDGGVQQVWGLGVPMWQTGWEIIGRPFGLSPFPDRLAMLFGIVLVLYALMRAWLGSSGDRTAASYGALLFTALLPGLVAMLRGRVAIYEEAQAYSYGCSMLLLACTIKMIRRPTTAMFLVLMGFAGATGLVRPTVWFYGLASAVVATPLYIAHRRSLRRRALPIVVLGWWLYIAGGAALYGTNYLRFGKGSEFGHRLNLQDLPGNIYATRFDYPFETTPTAANAKELVGALFGRPELKVPSGYHFYEKKLHPWQEPVARWREYYFTTYTWAYVPLLVGGLALTLLAWLRIRREDSDEPPSIIEGDALARESRWLGAWAIIGTLPLLVFYMRSPAVSSRYYIDIGPGFAVLVVIAFRHIATALRPRGLSKVALGVLAAWWVYSFFSFSSKWPWKSPLRHNAAIETAQQHTDPLATGRPMPDAYDIDDPWILEYVGGDQSRCPCYLDMYDERACDHLPYPGVRADVDEMHNDEYHVMVARLHNEPAPVCVSGGPWPTSCSLDDPDPAPPDPIPQPPEWEVEDRFVSVSLYRNGTNWDIATGIVGVATYLFVDDPEYVEVEVAPANGIPLTDFKPLVRAKVELEELPLIATTSTPRGVRLRFAQPKTEKYRHGLQIVFLAFGPPELLDQPASDYRLLRVAWHDKHRT